MDYREFVHKYVLEHKAEICKDLKDLVAIPSVRGEAAPGMPVGEGPAKALEFSCGLCEAQGMKLVCSEPGLYAEYSLNGKEKSLGLMCHVDVVPPNGEWLYTTPYEMAEKDGMLIGRGVADDKGSVIASLYALKALQASGVELKADVNIFLGANEESGMQCINSFARDHKSPDFSYAADVGSPMCRGEKNDLAFDCVCRTPFENVLDFCGGEMKNAVCPNVNVIIKYSAELEAQLAEAVAARKDSSFEIKDGNIVLHCTGVSVHACMPNASTVNAGAVAAEVLLACPALGANDLGIMEDIKAILGQYKGTIFGLECPDPDFGRFTMACGLLRTVNGRASFNTWRTCYTSTQTCEGVSAKLKEGLDKMGWDFIFVADRPGYEYPKDHPAVKAFMDEYERVLGYKEREAYCSKGATYARHLKNAIGIGYNCPAFEAPDYFPQGHGGLHCPDEAMFVESFLNGIEILAAAIVNVTDLLAEGVL